MAEPGYVDLFIDPNPNTPEGCGQRWKAEGAPRPIQTVRYFLAPDVPLVCDVAGVWSAGGAGLPCPAMAVEVEDSGAGASVLVYGGDWGLRLTPREGGGDPFGEPYLLLAPADILE